MHICADINVCISIHTHISLKRLGNNLCKCIPREFVIPVQFLSDYSCTLKKAACVSH